jgi:hypothetical protein
MIPEMNDAPSGDAFFVGRTISRGVTDLVRGFGARAFAQNASGTPREEASVQVPGPGLQDAAALLVAHALHFAVGVTADTPAIALRIIRAPGVLFVHTMPRTGLSDGGAFADESVKTFLVGIAVGAQSLVRRLAG